MYLGLKLLHIFFVIVAVGFNISYGIFIARASREPEHLGHVLRTIKMLDDRFANPAYGLVLVTGVAMTFVAGIPLTTFWIAAAIVLYVVLVLMGILLFSPNLKKQIELNDSHGAQSPEYQAVARRGRIIGTSFAVPILIILYLMVSKPQPM